MKKRERKWSLLIFSFLSLTGIIYLLISKDPSSSLNVANIKTSPVISFLFLFFVFILSTVWFITKKAFHGLNIAFFIIFYLFLRLLGLTNLFFLVVVLALILTLELLFYSKK